MRWKMPLACAALATVAACASRQPAPLAGGATPAGHRVPAAPQPSPSPIPAVSVPASGPPLVAVAAPAAPATQAVAKTAPSRPAPVAPSSPSHAASKPTATPAAAHSASPPPTLDLKSLEQRLRDTKAIGVFTKLSLKNQVDDLLASMKAFHGGQPQPPLPELRQSYESLLGKVIGVLQTGDPQLASAVSSSRDSIWALLSDPKKFAEIT